MKKAAPAAAPLSIRIEERTIASLRPADYNPRKISKAALKGLAASIGRFGLLEPIIINERSGNVVGGHQRLKVLEAKGVTSTACVICDLDETEERAANVALNNPNITGEFDTDALAELLKGIKAEESQLFADLRLDRLAGDVPIKAVEYVPKYEVVISCTGSQQEELYDRLTARASRSSFDR